MTEVFQRILSMSYSVSWLIFAILVFRLLVRKMPKWGNVLLWGLVALRLLFPFSIESRFCMIPGRQTTENLPTVNYVDNPVFNNSAVSIDGDISATTIFSIVWLAGVFILLTYFAVRYWRLLRKLNTAILLRDNIFQSEVVDAPIVMGFVNPRIYLPFNVKQLDVNYIIAHEQAHIRRRDHWWKLLGFVLLTLYWFNPLVWIAYVLLCRDIEMACDEAVIRDLDNEGRADYAQALVTYSTKRQVLAVHPLAFGENAVKSRLKAVMNYRKASRWSVAFIIVSCMLLAMCFLTDPVNAAQIDILPEVETGETIPPTTSAFDFIYTDPEIDGQMEVDLERLKQELADLRTEIEDRNKAYFEEREHQNTPGK